ncbi:amidohydrolase family protein [Candidatus Poribacteria bacterium]
MENMPIIDIHTHFHSDLSQYEVYLEAMERNRVESAVSLSQPLPVIGTNKALAYLAHLIAPEKFIPFTAIDYRDAGDPDFGHKAVERLAEDVEHGARGLKMHIHNTVISIHPYDDRLKPVYAKAGELGIPVLHHLSTRIGKGNSTLEKLDIHFSSETQYEALKLMLAEHGDTMFVIPHLGCCTDKDSLDRFSELMETHPNLYADTSATFLFFAMMKEPSVFRDFILHHEDRVIFGTDMDLNSTIDPERLGGFYNDAYDLSRKFFGSKGTYLLTDKQRKRRREWVHETHRWERLESHHGDMPGLELPDSTLRKLFYANAKRILGAERVVDKGWSLAQAEALKQDLVKAKETAQIPDDAFDYAQYLIIMGKYTNEFLKEVAAEKGSKALRTAISDRWEFSKAHTDRAIRILGEMMGEFGH